MKICSGLIPRLSGIFLGVVLLYSLPVALVSAQSVSTTTPPSESMLVSSSPPNLITSSLFDKKDLTLTANAPDEAAIAELLSKRRVEQPGLFTFFAWWIQDALLAGLSLNTIVLMLLLPVLATIIVFTRVIVGLPSLEMLVPIGLSYALVATGIILGGIILFSIVIASLLSRMLLKHVSIMYFPKRSLSLFLLSLFVLVTLSISIKLGIGNIAAVSIFPILIMTLLGDSLVSIQLHKSLREALTITLVTIAIGIIGFVLATSNAVRDLLVLYPEIILLLIPINIVMGRYFGLRLSEVFRFKSFKHYGSQ